MSWFEVMDDGLFARYAARGIASRQPRSSPGPSATAILACSSEAFTTSGALASWLSLL